ncbi:3-deoxy-7-phosphoheptulonate synthase [Candidatus Bathyarchaeota archaeon]|nr:MAG: 3-deoxy-7-phosphoheptulonate synthase [Candidatus Bathyarchaeota archaeon]
MSKIDNLNVQSFVPLIAPKELIKELPASEKVNETVISARETIQRILSKHDRRILVIVGPCSIHDEKSSMEYAKRLNQLRKKVEDTFFIVMRVYLEKPRTIVGWKGLINDPFLDGTHDIVEGLKKARSILLKVNGMGLPAGTEFVDPITPQYISTLISWAAIGARTIESQTHREMASGLSMPVGLKNSTDGTLTSALNALEAARTKQSFLGIDQDGHTCIVNTTGNPWVHIVLRGGPRPNYDPVSIDEALLQLKARDLPGNILVDCSHNNSGKKQRGQSFVWRNVVEQRLEGNNALIGLMLESNLFEGNQPLGEDASKLKYGVSITDECISWETTENLILAAHDRLLESGAFED